MLVGGGLNPDSDEAYAYASTMYASIRKRSTDCVVIHKNTNFPLERVTVIKNYIFKDKHILSSGYRYFYPCYEIAESWRRLFENGGRHIQPHDALLLHHEYMEILLILTQGLLQSEAHTIASKKYPYADECKKYYQRQGFKL